MDEKQLATIEEFAQRKTYRNGEYLLRAGDTEFKFHVIRTGRVEIVDRSSGVVHTVLVHEPGEFTGDLANLAGRASNVDAVALGDVDVYEISKSNFQQIISERPNLSDLILQTFIARSGALVGARRFHRPARHWFAVLAGHFSHPRFSVQNSVLYTWVNVETDTQAGVLLEQLQIRPEETPIVSYADDWMLRNPTNSELAEKVGLKALPASIRCMIWRLSVAARQVWRRRCTARLKGSIRSSWNASRPAGRQ
ncbi:MAG: cyclic nucleotide-binding domain-containing protein [Chloroflexi bacterium]|nr:cyclic nucleotide-binding domain-containing protein [Chloroflexota bacterium]